MLIIGISGVTNGGKTTLAHALLKLLPHSQLICQDDYFLPESSPLHTWIPEINHINWEIISSLDMDKMWDAITKILSDSESTQTSLQEKCNLEYNTQDVTKSGSELSLSNERVLIIEGFLVLNYQPIADICHLKYHLTLSREECYNRRSKRTYNPPDVPGFFDMCVWPEYIKHKETMLQNVPDVTIIDGTKNIDSIVEFVLNEIRNKIHSLKKK